MKFYVDPTSLKSKKSRVLFKRLVRKYGSYEVNYREHPRKYHSNFLPTVIKVNGNKELIRLLKKVKIRVSKKPIPALVDVKIIADLIHEFKVKTKPVGVDKNKEYIVYAPARGKILCDDPGVALFLIRGERVMWIESRNLDLTPLLAEIPSIPMKSISPKLISDLALAFSRITIGDRYVEGIQRILTEGLATEAEELTKEEELTVVSPEEKLVKELVDWGVIKFSVGELYPRAFIDVSGTPLKCQWFAVLFGLLSDYDYVVVNGVKWNSKLASFLRSNLIWVGNAPDKYFDFIIKDSRIHYKVNVLDREVEITEEFIPFHKLLEKC